jgi:hypothetical protein
MDKPSPHATMVEVTVASVNIKAEIKVITERIITKIKESG